MALLKLTFNGTFNNDLPGTHVDAGDSYSFEGIFDSQAPISLDLGELAIFQNALQSYQITVDGITFDTFSNSTVTVSDVADAESFAFSVSGVNTSGIKSFNFSGQNDNAFFLGDANLQDALNGFANYEASGFALVGTSSSAFADVQNQSVTVVPGPGSALLVGALALTAFSRKTRRSA